MCLLDQTPLNPRLSHVEYGSFVNTIYLSVTGGAIHTILPNSSETVSPFISLFIIFSLPDFIYVMDLFQDVGMLGDSSNQSIHDGSNFEYVCQTESGPL
jgi:sensor histidine kinase YesM